MKSNFKNALFHDMVVLDDVSGFSKMFVEWTYSPEKFGYEENSTVIKLREFKNHLKYNETFYIALIKNYRDIPGYRKTLLSIVVRFQQLSGWYLAALFLILFSRVWIR